MLPHKGSRQISQQKMFMITYKDTTEISMFNYHGVQKKKLHLCSE